MTHRSDYQTNTIGPLTFCDHLRHNVGIICIQMTDGFIQEQETAWLAQGTDKSHALLLTQRECATGTVHAFRQTQSLQLTAHLFHGGVTGQLAFEHHILHSREFAKETVLLKKDADVLPQQVGLLHHEGTAIGLCIKDLSLIVGTQSRDKGTERSLASTRLGLNQNRLALLQDHLPMPYIRRCFAGTRTDEDLG